MRAILPLLIALFATATLLGGCGDDGAKAAKAKKLEEVKAEQRIHAGKRADLSKNWSAVRLKVMPARAAWLRSKGTGEEAALKEAYDAVDADAKVVEKEEQAWERRKRELEDELYDLER